MTGITLIVGIFAILFYPLNTILSFILGGIALFLYVILSFSVLGLFMIGLFKVTFLTTLTTQTIKIHVHTYRYTCTLTKLVYFYLNIITKNKTTRFNQTREV